MSMYHNMNTTILYSEYLQLGITMPGATCINEIILGSGFVCLAPNHYLEYFWIDVKGTHRNNLRWNSYRYTKFLSAKSHYQNKN